MVAITYDYSNNNLMTAATATVIAKAENYTVDKELNDNDNVVAVGDIVTYTITTSVPYVTTTKGTDTDGNETTTMSPQRRKAFWSVRQGIWKEVPFRLAVRIRMLSYQPTEDYQVRHFSRIWINWGKGIISFFIFWTTRSAMRWTRSRLWIRRIPVRWEWRRGRIW